MTREEIYLNLKNEDYLWCVDIILKLESCDYRAPLEWALQLVNGFVSILHRDSPEYMRKWLEEFNYLFDTREGNPDFCLGRAKEIWNDKRGRSAFSNSISRLYGAYHHYLKSTHESSTSEKRRRYRTQIAYSVGSLFDSYSFDKSVMEEVASISWDFYQTVCGREGK